MLRRCSSSNFNTSAIFSFVIESEFLDRILAGERLIRGLQAECRQML